MASLPFATYTPKPSAWGYNWANENVSCQPASNFRSSPTGNVNGPSSQNSSPSSPEPYDQMTINQYMNLPAALLSSLKREKKPFTYTPGGINLSEVLNARLQKRLERKKKRSMMSPERTSSPQDNFPRIDPGKQVIVMPTYNTPLDMYSMENALEALEVQAELTVADKNFSGPSRSATLPRNHMFRFEDKDYDSNKNVVQSKAFKVLQIITDTEDEPKLECSGSKSPHHEEKRFTGIRESKEIPSKFFHNLQKLTGTDETEKEEQRRREMEHMGAPKSTLFNKQSTTRPVFVPQPQRQPTRPQQPNTPKVVAGKFQPMNRPAVAVQPQSFKPGPTMKDLPHLKRPAEFLASKLPTPMDQRKTVHPAFMANGPQHVFNPSGGTDF